MSSHSLSEAKVERGTTPRYFEFADGEMFITLKDHDGLIWKAARLLTVRMRAVNAGGRHFQFPEYELDDAEVWEAS